MTVVWWLRRDLRLHDNEALSTALEAGEPVIPLFILDPNLLSSQYVGDKRLAFLFANLRQLAEDLNSRGAQLIVRQGQPVEVMKKLRDQIGFNRIIAERDHSPYAQSRDREVGAVFPLQRVGSSAILPPGAVRKADGDPYVVYTPFHNRWLDQKLPSQVDLLPAPDRIPSPSGLTSESIPVSPAYQLEEHFPIGEAAARNRLAEYCAEQGNIGSYTQLRDRMAADGTSRLSPYLRFGLLSPREVFIAAQENLDRSEQKQRRQSTRQWISELIWRDFYIHILNFFPYARQQSFRQKYRDLAWPNEETQFDAWCRGQTGYPIVDAAMHQLLAIGWMHNRARMIVASFLVKDLLIDWRWGERFFMQHLIDGDPASNNGGWQWSAGTGTDAAPYFRIFNPISQSQKHDPEGEFIRRWLPQLERVPNRHIHQPWMMSKAEQAEYGCLIGSDYPAPIIEHSQARKRALDFYRSVE
jgi:deoxyribodipyrimidine photo-lyase